MFRESELVKRKKTLGKPLEMDRYLLPKMLPQPPREVLARLSVKGVGYVDVEDEGTYHIAEELFKLLAKKLKGSC